MTERQITRIIHCAWYCAKCFSFSLLCAHKIITIDALNTVMKNLQDGIEEC